MEVFEDAAPLAARQFMNRCREGAAHCFQGTAIFRVLPDHALFGGTPKGCAPLTVHPGYTSTSIHQLTAAAYMEPHG